MLSLPLPGGTQFHPLANLEAFQSANTFVKSEMGPSNLITMTTTTSTTSSAMIKHATQLRAYLGKNIKAATNRRVKRSYTETKSVQTMAASDSVVEILKDSYDSKDPDYLPDEPFSGIANHDEGEMIVSKKQRLNLNGNAEDIRFELFRVVRRLQDEVDAKAEEGGVCPTWVVSQLIQQLAQYHFTRWSRTLAELHLSLPTLLTVPQTVTVDLEKVSFELLVDKHLSQTIFVYVAVGVKQTIGFTIKINANNIHRSDNNVYLSNNTFHFPLPDNIGNVDNVAVTDTNPALSVAISQRHRSTGEGMGLSCCIGGEVRHGNIKRSPSTGEAKSASGMITGKDGSMSVVGTKKAKDAGRPLKTNVILLAGHPIRFDVWRTKGFTPETAIWASTKLQKQSDSRIIVPNKALVFTTLIC